MDRLNRLLQKAIMLNPLEWKREHRAGLATASAAGAIVAIAIGFANNDWRLRRLGLTYWLEHYAGDVIMWAVVGALVAGAAVYCWRVFSTQAGSSDEIAAATGSSTYQRPSGQEYPTRARNEPDTRRLAFALRAKQYPAGCPASAASPPRGTKVADIWRAVLQALWNFWNPTPELRAAMELPRSAGRFKAVWKSSWRWPVIWRRLVVIFVGVKLLDFGYFAVRGFETVALERQQQILKSGTKAFTPDESWGKPEELSYEELIRRGGKPLYGQDAARALCASGIDPRTAGLNFKCR
jgi:hypothetical protein